MGIELTEDQSKAVEQAGDWPPSVTDPRTRKTYLLVSVEMFQRAQSLAGEDVYQLSDTYKAQIDAAVGSGLERRDDGRLQRL